MLIKFQLETLKESHWRPGCKWKDNITRQTTYKIMLRRICLNTVATETQQCVACVLLSYICHCEQYKITFTALLLCGLVNNTAFLVLLT